MKVRCDNCEWKGEREETIEPSDLFERLDIGGIVPAGECPKCHSLVYRIIQGSFCIIRHQRVKENPPLLDVYRDDDGYPYIYETVQEATDAAKENDDDFPYGYVVAELNRDEEAN